MAIRFPEQGILTALPSHRDAVLARKCVKYEVAQMIRPWSHIRISVVCIALVGLFLSEPGTGTPPADIYLPIWQDDEGHPITVRFRYLHEGKSTDNNLHLLLAGEDMSHVQKLDFTSTDVTNDGLVDLAKFPQLREAELELDGHY